MDDQLIFTSLSHTHYWYEVGMLKVPAVTEALLYSKLPRAHPVVEPHACSHVIVKLTNDRDHIL